MDECLALADLGASINLMPLSLWNKISLPQLTPTLMTLELAYRSISRPIGVAEDVFIKVGKFHFPANFVVVDFDADPRVPLILGRLFLKTKKSLIDVYEGELTLRVGKEAITFNLYQTSRYSANYNDMTTNESTSLIWLGRSILKKFSVSPIDFLLEEINAFLALEDDSTSPEVNHSYFDTDEDILPFKAFLNNDPSLPPPTQGKYLPQVWKSLKICEAKNDKSSIDEPPEVELKVLPPHIEYAFLEDDDKFPVIISKDLSVEEKAALIKILMEDDFEPAVQHQRRVNLKIHDVIKKEVLKLLDIGLIYHISDSPWVYDGYLLRYDRKTMEVFMDHFSVFGNSFGTCLSHLEKMLKWCEDINLCLNWEKSHSMVKEGIVLGHKISKNEIEVDKAKVDVITKLPQHTTIKGIRSFLGHASFYQRFIQDFSKIAWPMTRLLEKDTPFFFSNDFIEAFQTLKKKLTEAPILVAPDWDLPFELMCDASDFAIGIVYTDHLTLKYLFSKQDTKLRLLRWVLLLQEFDITVCDKKRAENVAADHLSRLENPHQSVLDKKEINETFPLETLNMVLFRGDLSISCITFGMTPSCSKSVRIKSSGDVFMARKPLTFSRLTTMDPPGDIMARTTPPKRFGTPRVIIIDRGTHFCNDQFAKVMLKYGVTHRLATAYHP
nr:reverse transcriptase domain-containing protein [Tanacetum cinerariifolium]